MVDRATLTHYPRAWVQLSSTVGSVRQVDTGIVPARASVTRRSHSQAGEATVEIHGSALPFDPRLVAGVFVQVYLASPDTVGVDVRRAEWLRFVGFADELEPKRDEKGPTVRLKARDMSAVCRDFKPLPAAAHPRYDDTLETAINRILAATPGTRDPDGGEVRLSLRSSALASMSLSSIAPRRTPSAPVQLARDATAWAAIEHVCGLLNVLVSVRLDEIVLRKPADVHGHNRAPVTDFVFGGERANLLEVAERKKFIRNRKGVRVVALAPREPTGRVEGVYPPDAELLRDRRPSPRSRQGSTAAVERDVFPGTGLYTAEACRDLAERIYRERSRQEVEGSLKCPIWDDATLGLENGDRVTLSIDPDLAAELQGTRSNDARVTLLVRRLGISREAAAALIETADQRTATWYVRDVTHEFDADGVCSTSVEFINLIELE